MFKRLLLVFAVLSGSGLTGLPLMEPQRFGKPILEKDWGCLWWCQGTYKVGRYRRPPAGDSAPIRIEAARNEYEPVQIVIWPNRTMKSVSVRVEGLPAEIKWEYCKVEYVKVNRRTDLYGSVDWYPDPLPPIEGPLDLAAGRNHPLWLTAYVGKGVKAGLHNGEAVISEDGRVLARAPLELRVFDFALTDETHTETAYGMHINSGWHGPISGEQTRRIWKLYLQNTARHRVACYGPMSYISSIKVNVEGKGREAKVSVDFAEFDKAASYALDELKLTSFNFPYSVMPGELAGCKRGTPEYDAVHAKVQGAIVEHLKQKGWLSKCYTYWVDEPPPERYKGVQDGMRYIHEHLPGLRTLLTFCHEPAPIPLFYGDVDIWVPVLSCYEPKRAKERQAKGERVWWYVCCGPLSPFPNNFIDHPAINHRIRFWMMEKYGVDGSLYWSTTHWSHKNPWVDPMSYQNPEKNATWGNGDGYLLYPPTRKPPKEPLVKGPVNSIRFEMIREGLEDKEYLWLLRRAAGDRKVPELSLPDELVTTLVVFEHDARNLYDARRRLANAIERLSRR